MLEKSIPTGIESIFAKFTMKSMSEAFTVIILALTELEHKT